MENESVIEHTLVHNRCEYPHEFANNYSHHQHSVYRWQTEKNIRLNGFWHRLDLTCCPLPEPYFTSWEWSRSPDCWLTNLNVEPHVIASLLLNEYWNKTIRIEHCMRIFPFSIIGLSNEKVMSNTKSVSFCGNHRLVQSIWSVKIMFIIIFEKTVGKIRRKSEIFLWFFSEENFSFDVTRTSIVFIHRWICSNERWALDFF